MNFDYASLERRIAALEANCPPSLRFGRVTSVDGGKVRVQLGDGQNVVSHEISTLQNRVLKDQDIKMPDLGEPVACLFSGQGAEEGVILGAYYNGGNEQHPGKPAEYDYHKYADGTEMWYDRSSHKLIANVKGDVEITSEGHINIKAKSDIDAETEANAIVKVKGNMSANVEGRVDITSQGQINVSSSQNVVIKSSVNVTLKAPTISLAGILTITDMEGGVGHGTLYGTYTVKSGSFHVPDNDVTAGQVSVRGHTHMGVWSGPDISGTPVGG